MNHIQPHANTDVLRFDGENFKIKPASKYEHKYTYNLGSYNGAPFTTGGRSPDNLKTEIFDLKLNQWLQSEDYPYSSGD